jgi:hypothetical protein
MQITKLIHSTLLIEVKGKQILLDPGDYSIEHVKELKNIDLILITHTHPDHFHVDSVKALIANNPEVEIMGNSEVQKALADVHAVQICEGRQRVEWQGIAIEAFDNPHAEVWRNIPLPQNTGYMIDDYFYTPADGWEVIDKPVAVLAFMITGPLTRLKEAMDFAVAQKPAKAFGVHDGMLNRVTANHLVPAKFLPTEGVEYLNLEVGKAYEF